MSRPFESADLGYSRRCRPFHDQYATSDGPYRQVSDDGLGGFANPQVYTHFPFFEGRSSPFQHMRSYQSRFVDLDNINPLQRSCQPPGFSSIRCRRVWIPSDMRSAMCMGVGLQSDTGLPGHSPLRRRHSSSLDYRTFPQTHLLFPRTQHGWSQPILYRSRFASRLQDEDDESGDDFSQAYNFSRRNIQRSRCPRDSSCGGHHTPAWFDRHVGDYEDYEEWDDADEEVDFDDAHGSHHWSRS